MSSSEKSKSGLQNGESNDKRSSHRHESSNKDDRSKKISESKSSRRDHEYDRDRHKSSRDVKSRDSHHASSSRSSHSSHHKHRERDHRDDAKRHSSHKRSKGDSRKKSRSSSSDDSSSSSSSSDESDSDSSSSSSSSGSSVKRRKHSSKHRKHEHDRSSRHHTKSSSSSRHRDRSRSKERKDKDRERIRDKERPKEDESHKKKLENADTNENSALKKAKLEAEQIEKLHVKPESNTTSDLLKNMDVPREIRANPVEYAKYQAEQLKKRAEELTGVKVPSFYNSSAINPLLYAEQQKKRKLLWSKTKDNENTSTKIVGKAMIEGQDAKTAEKFRKLMGIKSDDVSSANESANSPKDVDQIQKMQKQAFEALDKEYEYARLTTHLNRGKGLGFASHAASVYLSQNQGSQPQ